MVLFSNLCILCNHWANIELQGLKFHTMLKLDLLLTLSSEPKRRQLKHGLKNGQTDDNLRTANHENDLERMLEIGRADGQIKDVSLKDRKTVFITTHS